MAWKYRLQPSALSIPLYRGLDAWSSLFGKLNAQSIKEIVFGIFAITQVSCSFTTIEDDFGVILAFLVTSYPIQNLYNLVLSNLMCNLTSRGELLYITFDGMCPIWSHQRYS